MTNTLFHAPLACSLAVRIAAAEGEVPLNISYLNLWTKEVENGGSLYDINPLGQVSVLKLDNGEIITETSTCILWINEQSQKDSFRIDPSDSRYFQLLRWTAFCATELHKQIFRVIFYPEATDPVKEKIRNLAPKRFDLLNTQLADREFLLGDSFSAADAYLTWFFILSDNAKLNTRHYQNLERYRTQVLSRPLVKELIANDRTKDSELGQNLENIS